MLGLLLLFGFWIAITIMLILPLVVTFALGAYLAEKLELDGFSYYMFLILFYLIILGLLTII